MNLFDLPSANVQSKSNEWYTSKPYIEAARTVMNGIDLDPASCELANRTVKANRYYTKDDNGLTLPWYGNVWLNPPYGRIYGTEGTTSFVSKLIQEYKQGTVQQAIILTMMGMYASWFFRLLEYLVCFLEEKPVFYRPDGTNGKLGFAACCTYLGPNESAFIEHFSKFGRIAKAVDTPKPKITPLSLWEVSHDNIS
jgi:DNA N-6-adenine-methyltransferase (Dam)